MSEIHSHFYPLPQVLRERASVSGMVACRSFVPKAKSAVLDQFALAN